MNSHIAETVIFYILTFAAIQGLLALISGCSLYFYAPRRPREIDGKHIPEAGRPSLSMVALNVTSCKTYSRRAIDWGRYPTGYLLTMVAIGGPLVWISAAYVWVSRRFFGSGVPLMPIVSPSAAPAVTPPAA